jgi:FkbM family methyltransferase
MIRNIKSRVRTRLKDFIERTAAPLTRPFGDSLWYEGPNLWEPPVLIALRDLLKPGDIAFDVGANFGGLTSAMARLAGPRGIVCSFEASPRIFPHLQGNIIKQGHFNVTAYPWAVFSRSNERVKIFPGDHLNDSLYDYGHGKEGEFFWINTIALDDFCTATGMVPSIIKIDIEGAEFDALNGAGRLIAGSRPHLILEQQPSDIRCLALLRAAGYIALDLSNYRTVNSATDFPSEASVRNVLFVHESKIDALPYALPVGRRVVCELTSQDFAHAATEVKAMRPIRLDAGRYLIDVDFTASGTSNELMCGVRSDGADLLRYHGYSKLLAGSYRDWVIDLKSPEAIELYFEFKNGTSDPSLRLSGARVQQLEQRSRPPLVLG